MKLIIITNPSINHFHLVMMCSLLICLSSAETCSFTQNTSQQDKQCVYSYSYTAESCNSSSLQPTTNLLFTSCRYKKIDEAAYAMSSDLKNCNNFCKKEESTTQLDNSYIIITVVAIGIIILIFLGICLLRRCICQPPPEQHFTHQIVLISSQRRLRTAAQNDAQFEQKWSDVDGNHFQWMEESQICAICLQNRTNIRLGCRHYFHYKCIRQWILIKDECPTCKSEDIEMPVILCMGCKKKTLAVSQVHYLLLQLKEKCQNCEG